ncbi:hypothetical protein VP1G_09749 [Cytospora mali]|uniref:Uncharacterized protein n=1 Tax=Cytospora mali TaxID=578113 RepID=A0A194VFH4_CYTMA|nr:hypothetical protein VP1G_09749 [Valsa mali var. pyri (nom. inval.)]
MPSLGNGNRKFQLPALDFKFGSLTEGTDIPPPPPSPKQEPREKAKAPQPPSQKPSIPSITTNGTQKSPETATSNGLKHPADEVPLPASPSSSTAGQGSIRRLLSRNRLDSVYANGDIKAGDGGMLHLNKPDSRPGTGSNASFATDKQSKRASGFFRRFRTSDGKVVVPADVRPSVASPTRPTGPPPPMIPEFKSLGSKVDLGDDGGSLGDDLFKNIK